MPTPDPGYEAWRERSALSRLREFYEPYINAYADVIEEVSQKMTRELLRQQTIITLAECEELEAWFNLGEDDGSQDN